jgi:hypothetical protein
MRRIEEKYWKYKQSNLYWDTRYIISDNSYFVFHILILHVLRWQAFSAGNYFLHLKKSNI